MKNNKGISLIVLIITIIVVIILAAVVILTLSKNNPIESAKEARFKEDVRTFQDELALTVSKQYTTAGGHRDAKITTSNFDEIKEYIPSFSEKYRGKFIIQDDELSYTGKITEKEEFYLANLNVKKGISYIVDELKLYLDGIDNTRNGHNNVTNVWENLVGNESLNLIGFDSSVNGHWKEKGLQFDGVDDGIDITNLTNIFKKDSTFEFVLNFDMNDERDIIMGNFKYNDPKNYVNFERYGNKLRIFWNDGQLDYNINNFFLNKNKIYIGISIDKENETMRIYKNGNFIEEIKSNLIKTYNYDYLNVNISRDNRVTNNFVYLKGEINIVRVYTKALTEDEIKHNYEIDKVRFGI